ncbi:type VI secretion system tip protein VgrG [Candidatus Binatia bacterium]|nr:type VI secretion system tip protein VgrG [Candidatus Binatia bacterium]
MAYTQDDRLIALDTPLGKDVLLLQSFTGVEGVSKLFSFQLALLSEQPAIEAQEILGKGAAITLTLGDGSARYFNGHVSRFVQAETTPRLTHYRLEMVPWLWFLTRTADCRIFQNQTIPQIVERIFKDLNFADYRLNLRGNYAPREYCVQYRETDFDFVSRLMEEAGIFYFFEHTVDKHVLVLADSPTAHEPCPGLPRARIEAGGGDDDDCITVWHTDHALISGKYTVGDFSFETPSTNLLATSAARATVGDNAALELYDFPGAYARKNEAETLARIRMEAEEATRQTVSGAGRCRAFSPGYRFELQGHFRAGRNVAYVLTEVRHDATAGSAYGTGEGEGERYANEFVCLPHSVPFRPPRLTPKPTVQGVQTAIVVGPKGEELHTDRLGRVRLQFHWDREGKYDEKSSCWVRVGQHWAGKRWGTVFLPRIGQEVIVAFVEGDPDRPLVVGRVYNAEQMPPYALPGEQTRSTIKSSSSKGGGGFNELRFEDKKGKEQVFFHAERQQDVRVKQDTREWVGRNRHLIVVGNQLEEVKGDKHLKVSGDRNEQVDGSVSLKVGMDHDRKVGMKFAEDAGMEIHLKGGMNVVIEAGMTVTLKAGAGFVTVGPAGVAISGTPIMINSGGAAGSGSGASPDPPKAPKEADKDKPGEKVKRPAARTASPQAIALRQAAREGRPFCEKCAEAARQAALARGATAAEAEEAAQAAGAAAEQEDKTWVEIELVDEAGQPVAGEEYRVELPDGSTRRGQLGGDGSVRIDGIDPGECTITFPGLKGRNPHRR